MACRQTGGVRPSTERRFDATGGRCGHVRKFAVREIVQEGLGGKTKLTPGFSPLGVDGVEVTDGFPQVDAAHRRRPASTVHLKPEFNSNFNVLLH
jgi:hypothetical protein